MKNDKLISKAMTLILALLLVSCASTPPEKQTDSYQTIQPRVSPPQRTEPAVRTEAPANPNSASSAAEAPGPKLRKGTGVFVRKPTATAEPEGTSGDVTLNFGNASLQEFLSVVFEQVLQENYLIDPQVKGQVTLHTSLPVERDAVIPIVEAVLQINGAALIYDKGLYRIVPLANAPSEAASPTVGRQAGGSSGFGTRIVPLRYAAASDMEKLLQPLIPKGSTVSIDAARNLLILSGPRYRIDKMMETVQIFDVDWLKGMSFGIFRLQYAEATTLVSEIEQVIGAEGKGPLSGVVRLTPIERLNAVLVVTQTPRYLDEMTRFIEQFDLGVEGTAGRRLYVYHLKNAKAENLAGVLQEIYGLGDGGGGGGRDVTAAIEQVPPGTGPNVFQTAEAVSRPPPPVGGGPGAGGDYRRPAPLTGPQAGVMEARVTAETEQPEGSIEGLGMVNIIADQDNNAILVMANPSDYRSIEAVIRQLDIPPRQVLIDATIAEVTLSKGLDYGVRWFLQQNNLRIGFNAPVPEVAAGEGLALALFKSGGDAKIFIDLLETQTSVKFLSAPQVMVLDNQTANIRVGDQIPVTVRSSQSTTDPDSPIVSEVQFRDTGTLLSVTPRVNAGGKVTLNISQEVSLPGSEPSVGGGGNVAISQRTIDSSVIVQSGQTVVLGGLILETRNEAQTGIPILMDIPWLGRLFSNSTEDVFRTELIVMITPQVMEDEAEADAVTEELRRRMKKPVEFQQQVKPM